MIVFALMSMITRAVGGWGLWSSHAVGRGVVRPAFASPAFAPAVTMKCIASSSIRSSVDELNVASTKAEGGLSSEAGVLQEQARQAQQLDNTENLLSAAPRSASSASGDGDERP